MVDVNCLQCGKKIGEASKVSRDDTDTTKNVLDYAGLCGGCASGNRTALKKAVVDKLKTDKATAIIAVAAEEIP